MGPVWTPFDASGAGLTFTNASGTYLELNGFVIASAVLTFPSTADTSNAAIGGFPVMAASAQGAPAGGNTNLWVQMQAGTTTAFLWVTAAQAVRRINSGASTLPINFTVIYPAMP